MADTDSDNFQTLVLEALRDMREEVHATHALTLETKNELSAFRTDARERLTQTNLRLTSMEHHLAGLVASDLVRDGSLAALETRIDRIERRLELRDN